MMMIKFVCWEIWPVAPCVAFQKINCDQLGLPYLHNTFSLSLQLRSYVSMLITIYWVDQTAFA